MSPSLISASASTAGRPRFMSIVSTVIVPKPLKLRGRRTWRQRTAARRFAVWRTRSRRTADGSHARVRVRRTARRQLRRDCAGVALAGTRGHLDAARPRC